MMVVCVISLAGTPVLRVCFPWVETAVTTRTYRPGPSMGEGKSYVCHTRGEHLYAIGFSGTDSILIPVPVGHVANCDRSRLSLSLSARIFGSLKWHGGENQPAKEVSLSAYISNPRTSIWRSAINSWKLGAVCCASITEGPYYNVLAQLLRKVKNPSSTTGHF